MKSPWASIATQIAPNSLGLGQGTAHVAVTAITECQIN